MTDILAGIPHDAASIFIYLLLIVAVGWVVRTGLQKKKPTDD